MYDNRRRAYFCGAMSMFVGPRPIAVTGARGQRLVNPGAILLLEAVPKGHDRAPNSERRRVVVVYWLTEF